MNSMIKEVFSILGMLVLSLVIWGFMFGSVGRTFIWTAMEPACINHWERCTLNDGAEYKDAYTRLMDSVPGYDPY